MAILRQCDHCKDSSEDAWIYRERHFKHGRIAKTYHFCQECVGGYDKLWDDLYVDINTYTQQLQDDTQS